MATFTSAQVFPPGEFIADELEARGWSQTDLAEIMGRPIKTISELVTGKKAVTPETAIGLAKAFGTSADVWLGLESAYRLSLVKPDETNDVERRAHLYSVAPVKDMMKRQWIKQTTDPDVIEKELKTFFGSPSLEEWKNAANSHLPQRRLALTLRLLRSNAPGSEESAIWLGPFVRQYLIVQHSRHSSRSSEN